MNVQITETKRIYKREIQSWEINIFITFNHKKYVVRKEYFLIGGLPVKGFRNKIYTQVRDYGGV